MKKMIVFTLSVCLLIFSSILVKNTVTKTPISYAKSTYQASSIKGLAKDSDLVLIGEVDKDKTITTLQDVEFVISKLNVTESIKGSIPIDSKINILQTKDIDIDPELVANQSVLLFLEKYTGPITENAYVIKGLYQGNYTITNGILKASKASNSEVSTKINAKKIIDIKKDLIEVN